MILFGRQLEDIPKALLDKRRYATFGRMYATYPRFWHSVARFVSAKGSYPYDCEVRTPIGTISVTLHSHHDFFTLNEIFCRLDYGVDARTRVVLDVGSNIGISGLYFLTRNTQNFCYLHEPNPANIGKLVANLAGFEGRYSLSTTAVDDARGEVSFGVERTGRYGGIGVEGESEITVECEHVNDVIERVLAKHARLNLIKIDTEGTELRIAKAIDPRFLEKIGAIYMEAAPTEHVLPAFAQTQRFSICRLGSRKVPLTF